MLPLYVRTHKKAASWCFALTLVTQSSLFSKHSGRFFVCSCSFFRPELTVRFSHSSAGEKVFGFDTNKKGFKVLRGVGVIQGDGIGHKAVGDILEKAKEEGYSAQNMAFGMGAGLLQNVNRDTMSFATKLCHIVYHDGTPRFDTSTATAIFWPRR